MGHDPIAHYCIELLRQIRSRYDSALSARDKRAIDDALAVRDEAAVPRGRPPTIDPAEALRLGVTRSAISAAIKRAKTD